MKYQKPKGTRDLINQDFYFIRYINETILSVMESYGYKQIRTPMFESLELLNKDAGEEVAGQIYKITDKSGRLYGLKSDITPAVARIVVSQGKSMPKPIKFACADRVYRYERPQKGRYREITQVNAEMFGAKKPQSDAESIACMYSCYKKLGLENMIIKIGYRPLLEIYIKKFVTKTKNIEEVIRIVDKKEKLAESDFIKLLLESGVSKKDIPNLSNFLNLQGKPIEIVEKAKKFFENNNIALNYLTNLKEIIKYLKSRDIDKNVQVDFNLARGSGYYTGVIFEAKYPKMNEFGSLGGGGRYDNLISSFGGLDTPAMGFSIGVDRLALLLKKTNKTKNFFCDLESVA